MKKLIVVMMAGFIGMQMSGKGIVLAADGHDHGATTGQAVTGATAQEELCPVTGEAVDQKLSYTYKGKVYHFCCASCIADFKKDPEKYIKKMKDSAAGSKSHDHHDE